MHRLALAPYLVGRQVDFNPAKRDLAGGCHGAGLTMPAQLGADACEQLGHTERLGQVIIGTCVQGGNFLFFAIPRRQHQNRHCQPTAQFADQLFAVAIRQAEVDDHQVRLTAGGMDQCAFDAVGLEHLKTFILQGDPDEAADIGFVFNNQNACGAHKASMGGGVPAGKVMMKCMPHASTALASMRPPWASTMRLASARPRPMPATDDSCWPRVKGSNKLAGARPGPLSLTSSTMVSAAERAATVMLLPGGVYLAALSNRLTSTRSINSASISTSGNRGSSAVCTQCCARGSRNWRSALPTISSSECHCRFRRTPRSCMRAMSSRFSISRCIDVACSWMPCSGSVSAR